MVESGTAALTRQLLGRGCQFFGGGRILLDHLIELLNGLVDLRGSNALFGTGRGNLAHQVSGFLNIGNQFRQQLPAPSAVWTPSTVRRLISAAAVWLRSASFRTSDATTAKPLPCSPARAALTAFEENVGHRPAAGQRDSSGSIGCMAY